MTKKILYLLGIILVLIQFIPSTKNISTVAQPNDIAVTMNVPDNVNIILRKACYDCHSNTSNYPWYSSIQPVAWWMEDHIKEGKKELNFSEFGSFTLKRKVKKFTEIANEVTEGEMPLSSYTWMHKDAKLTNDETNLLINWANDMAAKLEHERTSAILK